MRLAKPILIEWPARGKKLYEFKADFLQTLEPIKERILKARNPQAEEITRHIIGIERWGQHRLSVAWGQPLVMDEHHAYKPPQGLSQEALATEFHNTRWHTLWVVERLYSTIDPEYIPHNAMGPLSIRGWLYYLYLHANWESRKLR